MNKKAIAILGAIFILIVGTLGFLIYVKYSKKDNSPTATQTTTNNNSSPNNSENPSGNSNLSSTTPVTQGSATLVKLADDQVVSPVLFYNGQGVTYFNNQGNLFQAALQDNNGQMQLTNKNQINIPAKPNITNVIWPPKGSDFIVRYINSSGQPAFSYFNSTTQTYTDLPPQVATLDWMPDGKQILYVWLENGKSTLNIGNPDSTGWKYLADMWENDDEIHISPDGSQLLYYGVNNSAATINAINSATTDGKVWKSLVKSGQNLGVLWSPDGQKFLFGKKDLTTQGLQLWVYNLTSGEVKNLGILTAPQKAVWAKDSTTIYAAVPNSPNGSSGLTTDSFYKLDINTLQKNQLNLGVASSVDGMDLFLSSTGDNLLFRNAQDGGLYSLNLTTSQ